MEKSGNSVDILLKNATLPNGNCVTLEIKDGKISSIIKPNSQSEKESEKSADKILNCTDKIVMPPFVNSHTHAAMTLFRGWGDDLPLHEWLTTKIWPTEANMTEEDVYVGTRLACLEMIKTGTTFFNDMYWHPEGTIRAVKDSGIRAMVSGVMIDMFDFDTAKRRREEALELLEKHISDSDRIQMALGPHAIYTVSEDSLAWCAETARKMNIKLHIHLSETEKEVLDCKAKYGLSPVELLERVGFLQADVIAAHCVWLSDRDVELLSEYNVTVAHIPVSNMKLAVGREFRHKRLRDAGITIAIGTDGCGSNNNLDMFSEIKIAAMVEKSRGNDPLAVTAKEIFKQSTEVSSERFSLNSGVIEVGRDADLVLLDSNNPLLVPSHDIISNIVYSATDSCVDTVICAGKILMESRVIEGEKEIIQEARRTANTLCR